MPPGTGMLSDLDEPTPTLRGESSWKPRSTSLVVMAASLER